MQVRVAAGVVVVEEAAAEEAAAAAAAAGDVAVVTAAEARFRSEYDAGLDTTCLTVQVQSLSFNRSMPVSASKEGFMSVKDGSLDRRKFMMSTVVVLGLNALALSGRRIAYGLDLKDLTIVCADSIRPMMEGPFKTSAATALLLDLHSEGRSEDRIPALLLDSGTQYDVLVSLMASSTLAALHAGKASIATPVAATEMVLAFSPTSPLASRLISESKNGTAWYTLLQQPGVRFARSDPRYDPSGRASIFTLLLAEAKNGQRDLARTVLGRIMNEDQILSEPRIFPALRDGQRDVALCYKTTAAQARVPFIALPSDVNLGKDWALDPSTVHFTLGETKYYAEPLIYYASALESSSRPDRARTFINWLKSESAKTLLEEHQYDVPAGAKLLKA